MILALSRSMHARPHRIMLTRPAIPCGANKLIASKSCQPLLEGWAAKMVE